MTKHRNAEVLQETITALLQDDVVSADKMAAATGRSTRTIYRLIATMKAAGVPIIGEAGMGYMLREKRK